jgi:hypothetical protein
MAIPILSELGLVRMGKIPPSFPARHCATRLAAWAKQAHEAGRRVILCGDMNIT